MQEQDAYFVCESIGIQLFDCRCRCCVVWCLVSVVVVVGGGGDGCDDDTGSKFNTSFTYSIVFVPVVIFSVYFVFILVRQSHLFDQSI